MASHPDANPDSLPPAESDDVEQLSPENPPQRENIEDSPGMDGGTGGTNHRGDRDITP